VWTRLHSCVGLVVRVWLLTCFNTFSFHLSSTHLFTTLHICLGISHLMVAHLSWCNVVISSMIWVSICYAAYVRMKHCNPWYIFKCCCNCRVGKWRSCTERGCPPFPLPYTKTNGYYHHQRGLKTLVNVIIINSTHTNLIQHALTMTEHVTIVVVQKKAQSYTKARAKRWFIPFVIKTYGCLHPHFDSFLTSCVHANIAHH
jgi:hypothetical protein